MKKFINGDYYEMTDNEINKLKEISKITTDKEQPELTTDEIAEILAEQEYRICLLELGVDENDIQTM